MLSALPIWLQAGIWGLLAAGSLLIGAAAAYLVRLGVRATAAIMSFGCGVLISAVAYDLIFEGFQQAGMRPVILGALGGAIAYAVANWVVSHRGGRHRKRSGQQQSKSPGGGLAIAIGSLLDGVPESVVLVQSVAAGALLTMVADTMIPGAVEGEHGVAGVLVVVGLLLAFALSH